MDKFKDFMNVSRQLIWPAAAGNILWASLTLLADQIKAKDLSRAEDYGAFLILFIYVSWNFLAGRNLSYFNDMNAFEKTLAIIFEYAHIVLICLFSILLYLDLEFEKLALTLIFGLVSMMHVLQLSPNSGKYPGRYALTGIVGIFSLLLFSKCVSSLESYSAFISLFFAVSYWMYLRKKFS